jgi:hypothetical protein
MKILNPPNGFVSMHDPYTRLRGNTIIKRGGWSPAPRRMDIYTVQCAWCNRVARVSGEWTEGIVFGRITHGICPECFQKHKPKGKKNG